MCLHLLQDWMQYLNGLPPQMGCMSMVYAATAEGIRDGEHAFGLLTLSVGERASHICQPVLWVQVWLPPSQ